MNYLDEAEKIIIEECEPLDIQKHSDIDHVKRLLTIEGVCKKIINFLIISEKNNIIDDINRCQSLIHKCFKIVEKENKYDQGQFSSYFILTQYLKKAKEGSLLSVEQVKQLEMRVKQASEQIILFLEFIYPLENYNFMPKDEKNKYDSLCQRFESLKKEYELSYNLLIKQDMRNLSFEKFYISKLNKSGLMSSKNVFDYDTIDAILKHNLEIAKQYVNEYAQFDKDNNISGKDKAKKLFFGAFLFAQITDPYIIIEC